MSARAFPGKSAVWIGGVLVILVGTLLLGRMLLARTASITGTNSVDVGAVIGHAGPNELTCVRDLVIPKHTGRVQVWLGVVEARPSGRLEAWVQSASSGRRLPLRPVDPEGAGDFKSFVLTQPLRRTLQDASICLVPRAEAVDLGGASVQRLPQAKVSTIGGRPLTGVDVAVRFVRAAGDSPRVLDTVGSALSRATLFDPGVARVAIYLALLMLLLAIYGVLRVAATAERIAVQRLALAAAALALVNSCAWILLLQPFHGADESEHFAYAQHIATTGERPDDTQTARSPYASSELRLMEAVHHNSTILNPSSRLRWDHFYDRQYEAVLKKGGLSSSDGGGYTESATGHSPLYYSVVALPYLLIGRTDDVASAILVMRLFNALFAACIAGLAVLTAALMFPRCREAAWLAGVLVAMQPVFASVSASVNNDTAVNLLAALFVYLALRAWRVGLRPRDAALLGAVTVLLPVAKITGLALLPVLAVVAVVVATRHGLSLAARWGGIAVASAAVIAVLWIFAIAPLISGERGRLINAHPGPVSTASTTTVAAMGPPPIVTSLSMSPSGRLQYFLKTFVPIAPGPRRWALARQHRLSRWPAFTIYVDRGYGFYGWNSTVGLSFNTLLLIFLGLTAGWMLALGAAVRARRRWRSWMGGALILLATIMAVLVFVSFAYAKPNVVTEPGEQGRYLFTALVPLAVLMSGCVLALRGRVAALVLGGGVGAAWTVGVLGWMTALRGWYT